MLAALRSRALSLSSTTPSTALSPPQSAAIHHQWKLAFNRSFCSSSSSSSLVEETSNNINNKGGYLNLEEVEKILHDVHADDIKVIPVQKHADFTDYVVIATGRSPWHVRNIAQALIYKVKQKQVGAKRMILPSVEGEQDGKWVVIDSRSLIIHALEEKARAYYNLERLWTTEELIPEPNQELEKAFVKVRRKNNSKKSVKSLLCRAPA